MNYINRPAAPMPIPEPEPKKPLPLLEALRGDALLLAMKRMAAQECARMGGVPGGMPPATKDGKPIRRETPEEICKALLTRLRSSPGCSLARLAKALDAPQPSIAPIVDGMLAAGLIYERISRKPGSSVEVLTTYWLTEKGLIRQKGGNV